MGLALPGLAALPEADGSVKPATVVQRHRQGFCRYWRWRSRARHLGRPGLNREIRELVRQMNFRPTNSTLPRLQEENPMYAEAALGLSAANGRTAFDYGSGDVDGGGKA